MGGGASQEFHHVPSFAWYFEYFQILGTRPKFMSALNFLIYCRETWDVYQMFAKCPSSLEIRHF